MQAESVNAAERGFREIMDRMGIPSLTEQVAGLHAQMMEKNFTMKGEPFPTFLKPHLVDKNLKPFFEKATLTIMNCVEKVGDLFFSSPEYEQYFEMDAVDLELSRIDPRYPRRVINGRLDAFLSFGAEGPELKFLEFNCDSPCGMGWHDQLIGMLSALPLYQEFDKAFGAFREPLVPSLLQGLQTKNREFGNPEGATFAILCWEDSSVVYDLKLIADNFKAMGQPAIWADNRWGEYDGKTLKMKGTEVGLIFRDAIQEFTDDMEGTKPVLDAFRDGKVCFVNPFSSRVGGLKCVLGFLTDEKAGHLFTAEEKEIIQKTVPWTRFMRPEKTDYKGREVDLFEFVRAERERLILKPNAGYGGFGVTIGPETTAADWDRALEECSKAPWVVQDFVSIPKDTFPVLRDGTLTWEEKNANINFFAHNGRLGGGLVRVSDSAIINIHQGGGLVPICYVP
ncbi:MAG: hypothetical protein ACYTHN_15545 [Planctomycetota bacterium]|jgi:hypothetical protein